MKPVFTFTAILACIAVLAGTALAQQPSVPRTSRAFAKLDADQNGKVTAQELELKAAKAFFRMDGDNNGEVTSAEIDAALLKLANARRNRMLKAMDADASGGVTKAELENYVTVLMTTADANADGGVTLDEARSFRIAKLKK